MSVTIFSPGFTCPDNAQSSKKCISQFTAKVYSDNLTNLSVAHNRRILLGQLDSNLIGWHLSLGLAFIASLTTVAIYRNNKTPAVVSLTLFLIALWLTLSIVALHHSPYRGPKTLQKVIGQ